MTEYQFTEIAESDLAAIIKFTLTTWGNKKTHEYIDELEEMGQTLADNPDIGLKKDNLLKGLHCFPYKSHILYYVVAPHGITIIRVLPKSMDSEQHIQ
jgi:toxin ParE1/3/4